MPETKSRMNCPTLPAQIFFVLTAMILFLFSSTPAEAAPQRELQVGVAVTPSYKSDPEWKLKFEKRLAYVSQIFKREFDLSFRPVFYRDWMPSDEADMGTLFEDLRAVFPLLKADFMIGLSGFFPSQVPNVNDPEVIGRTRPFSGYLLLRRPPEGLFKAQEETVLVHELGHLFGAVHAPGADLLMSPVIDRQVPTQFDAANRDMVMAARGIDFKKGDAALDQASARRLLESYQKVIREGQPFEYYYALGNLYLRLGQGKEALEPLQKAAELDDRNALLQYDLGVLCFQLSRQDEAVSHLDRAVQFFQSPAQSARRADALQMLGAAHFMKQHYDAARRFWLEAASLKPENLDLKVNLGVVEMKLGHPREAIRSLEEAVRLGSRDGTVFGSLGAAYFEMGDYARAADYFQQAVRASSSQIPSAGAWDSVNPAALYAQLAQTYLKLNRQVEAAASFETSCQLDPSPGCRLRLGQLYFGMRRWDESIRQLGSVLNDYRSDANLYGMLGSAFSQKGDNEKALAIFQEGVRQVSDHTAQALFYTNIGDLYLRENQSNLAASEFQKAIDCNWNNPDAHAGLAIAYFNQNQVDRARQSLEHALNLDPKHGVSKKILAQLGKRSG